MSAESQGGDISVLSSELSGVLAQVLSGLNERVEKLESTLAHANEGKANAEAQLEAANERIEKLEKSQGRLEEASHQLEASLEASMADMLKELSEVEGAVTDAAQEAKRMVEESMAGMEESLEASLSGMSTDLSGMRAEINEVTAVAAEVRVAQEEVAKSVPQAGAKQQPEATQKRASSAAPFSHERRSAPTTESVLTSGVITQ